MSAGIRNGAGFLDGVSKWQAFWGRGVLTVLTSPLFFISFGAPLMAQAKRSHSCVFVAHSK